MTTHPTRLPFALAVALLCSTATLPACSGSENDEPGSELTDAGDWTPDTGADTHSADTNDAPPDTSTGDTGTADTRADVAPDCVPDKKIWQAHTRAMVDDFCGKCHGDEPKFGAPYSLTTYSDLIAGPAGERKVDVMAERLLAREMPPANAAQPPHDVMDTLVEWTTCGQKHPDHSKGLKASAPPLSAPDQPPADARPFDVRADNFELGADELNRYQCFTIPAPFDETRFVRRIEPVIDDSRVLHHALLSVDRGSSVEEKRFKCNGFPPGEDLIYGWAPGQQPVQLPDGGLRVEPGDQFVLQIHYNNGAGADDVSDSSGVRVYHSATAEHEYVMADLGPKAFILSPDSRSSAADTCQVRSETRLVASFPHMHALGSEFHQSVTRTDGTEESIIDLTGWSFEAQMAYETPMTFQPGDKIRTECVWYNSTAAPVTFGLRTEDEMCYNFMYVTPPNEHFCR